MNDNDKIKYLISISRGLCTPAAFAKEHQLSLIETNKIFQDLEDDGLITEKSYSVPILGAFGNFEVKYVLTDDGKDLSDEN